MSNVSVQVLGIGLGEFTVLISEGLHASVADEPAALGGNGLGPDPYALLLMSLGACTAMTLRLYARSHRFPLEDVGVELTHDRVHAVDCADCDGGEVFVDRIERSIGLSGPLSNDQKALLMAVADKCPIHRSLIGKLEIRSRMKIDPKPTS